MVYACSNVLQKNNSTCFRRGLLENNIDMDQKLLVINPSEVGSGSTSKINSVWFSFRSIDSRNCVCLVKPIQGAYTTPDRFVSVSYVKTRFHRIPTRARTIEKELSFRTLEGGTSKLPRYLISLHGAAHVRLDQFSKLPFWVICAQNYLEGGTLLGRELIMPSRS